MSEQEKPTVSPNRPEQKQQENESSRVFAVDMRQDQDGDRYPVKMGSGGPDKEGYGSKVKMNSYTVSGWLNIMTEKEVTKARKDYQSVLRARRSGDSHDQNDRGRE